MTAALHLTAIALSAMCFVVSIFGTAQRNKMAIWGDAIMVVTMVASVITTDAAVALLGGVLLVATAIIEAIMMRRSYQPSAATRANIIHRSICFIAMAFLLVAMVPHSQDSSPHAHQGAFMPALLSLTGAALIMAVISVARHTRLLVATSAGTQAITHYIVESGGMVAATALMLAAVLL